MDRVGKTAEHLQIKDNLIIGNGLTGISNAIHLEGFIDGTEIDSNLICGNDGSGIYLFKPDGVTNIKRRSI